MKIIKIKNFYFGNATKIYDNPPITPPYDKNNKIIEIGKTIKNPQI
jgi:hypothetical protein